MMKQQGAVDEGEVAECLRSVTELPVRAEIPFLTQQSDIVAQAQQPLKECDSLVPSSRALECVHEPEGTREEDAFTARQPVVAVLRPVAQHETVLREVPLDGLDGADDPLVVRGQESDSG